MPKELNTQRSFAMIVVETSDYFGIVCSNKGVINCRQSAGEFVKEHCDMQHDYHNRDHTWAASAAVFDMSFPRTVITVDNEEHASQLLPQPPHKLVSLSNVAGHMYIIPCEKEQFKEVLDRGVKL